MDMSFVTTVQDGVIKMEVPVDLPAGTQVHVTLSPCPSKQEQDQAWEEWEKLCDETRLDASATRLTRDQLHERH